MVQISVEVISDPLLQASKVNVNQKTVAAGFHARERRRE